MKILLSDKIFYWQIFFAGEIFHWRILFADEYFLPDGFRLLCFDLFLLKTEGFGCQISVLALFFERKPDRKWKKYDNLSIFCCFTVLLPLISQKAKVLSITYG